MTGVAVLIVAAWLASALAPLAAPSTAGAASWIGGLLLPAFAWTHGAARYGWRAITGFMLAMIVTSYLIEALSIRTGFPFGFFHHLPPNGPQLFGVALIVAPTYFALGYIGWAIAALLLDGADTDPRPSSLPALLLTAPFIATGWDAMTDPGGATDLGGWRFDHPGGLFGVPFSNFFGWMVVMFVGLALGGVWLRRGGRKAAPAGRLWWALPPVLLALQIVPTAMSWLAFPGRIATDAAHRAWDTHLLYEASTIVGVFTCGAFGALGLAASLRRR